MLPRRAEAPPFSSFFVYASVAHSSMLFPPGGRRPDFPFPVRGAPFFFRSPDEFFPQSKKSGPFLLRPWSSGRPPSFPFPSFFFFGGGNLLKRAISLLPIFFFGRPVSSFPYTADGLTLQALANATSFFSLFFFGPYFFFVVERDTPLSRKRVSLCLNGATFFFFPPPSFPFPPLDVATRFFWRVRFLDSLRSFPTTLSPKTLRNKRVPLEWHAFFLATFSFF